MNRLEKLIYNRIKHQPRIKFAIRNLYQTIFDLIPSPKLKCSLPIDVREGYFFGFHDHSPYSEDNKLLLANKLEIPLRMPEKNDPLTIGYFKGENHKEYITLDKTYSWNYHKGCRLQWLGKSSNQIVFNSFNSSLKAKIIDLNSGNTKLIDYPIDSVSYNGNYATNFSYERLENFMPGYGYKYKDNGFVNDKAPSDTGLYIIDINKNTRSMLINLNDLVRQSHKKSMDESWHFVTHTLFSYDNKYVSFLHRWVEKDITKRHTRLVIMNLEGQEIYISPTTDMVSHYVWDSNNGIVAYCSIDNIDSHVYFKDPSMKDYQRVGFPELNSDGHQHMFPNSNSFISDTYPNRGRFAKIFKVNIDTNSVKKLAELKSLRKFQTKNIYKHWACDLHPRINRDGSQVCFDSVHTGTRSLCTIKI